MIYKWIDVSKFFYHYVTDIRTGDENFPFWGWTYDRKEKHLNLCHFRDLEDAQSIDYVEWPKEITEYRQMIEDIFTLWKR